MTTNLSVSKSARENRPWTRWWWMGSALDEGEITRSLEQFHEVGLGGVEISPIYGVRGEEARWVPFLSDRWMELLSHTIGEAERLDLGVDLILGTGWPYGGPWVEDADAPGRLVWETLSEYAPRVSEAHPDATFLAAAEPDSEENQLALFLAPTGQQVKRAAPGGEGNVLDPYSADAVRRYLAAFEKPLAQLPAGRSLRCLFNDSFEVFGANGTPDLLAEFAARRGYDLRAHLHALRGAGEYRELVQRVRSDYRETIGDLVLDAFLGNWCAWAGKHHLRTRNQAHGSPGNLLDLYAIADIPETEVFGPPRLTLGGMRALRPAPPDFGESEEALICRFAASAAHVAGRPLCSSESFTWMGEHGCVPLAHGKAEVDMLFTLGINHVFFHGTPSSPPDAKWPGHLFYATTHVAPTNPFWRDLAALNGYITACQQTLQAGVPDSDVLLYFPYYDLLATENGVQEGLHMLSVHRTDIWLRENLAAFSAAARDLTAGGWAYDLISDRQIKNDVVVESGDIAASVGGARWRAIVIAGAYLMPPETLEAIAALAREGATVLVLGDLPGDVPGLGGWEPRRERLADARAILRRADGLYTGFDLGDLMREANIAPEPVASSGIEFIRRRGTDGGVTYFFSNPGTSDYADWVALRHCDEGVTFFDPMSGDEAAARVRTGPDEETRIWLELPAGSSVIVRPATAGQTFVESTLISQNPADLRTTLDLTEYAWQVDFLEGGPDIPTSRPATSLTDWTTWSGGDSDALQAFSGTARYAVSFDAPGHADSDCWLDLGDVLHSASVRFNGVGQGTLIARPWRLRLQTPLKAVGNLLEIEVTNLMANRLAELERRRGEAWRPFLMVNIHYKPFDAATWEPLPSGLVGPVRLLSRAE